MVHSLQLNPLHQTSGDSGRLSCGAFVLASFLFLLYFPVRLYFPLVPDDTGQKLVARKGEKTYLSASPVLKVGPVCSRNLCRRMNTTEVSGHGTPSSVESGGSRGLCGGKVSDSLMRLSNPLACLLAGTIYTLQTSRNSFHRTVRVINRHGPDVRCRIHTLDRRAHLHQRSRGRSPN